MTIFVAFAKKKEFLKTSLPETCQSFIASFPSRPQLSAISLPLSNLYCSMLKGNIRVSKRKGPGILDPGHSKIIWTFLKYNNNYMHTVFMSGLVYLNFNF